MRKGKVPSSRLAQATKIKDEIKALDSEDHKLVDQFAIITKPDKLSNNKLRQIKEIKNKINKMNKEFIKLKSQLAKLMYRDKKLLPDNISLGLSFRSNKAT